MPTRWNQSGFDQNSLKWTRLSLGQMPTPSSNKLAKLRKIKLGWTLARVEILPERPVLCYKCFKGGHVRAKCQSTEKRVDICYCCCSRGHRATEGNVAPRCIVCEERKQAANHRIGSRS